MANSHSHLVAHLLGGSPLLVRPAPADREWMDATGERFAYRCLPLTIANAHGWEILSPVGFAAGWTGGADIGAVVVQTDGGAPAPAISHFGNGILTFHMPAVFRTSLGYDLWIQGPVNRPKDGIYPLTGVVETDWSVATFTMNWIFTRPGVLLRFEAGEPICHIFPVKRGALEAVAPELRRLSDTLELQTAHEAWASSRADFNTGLAAEGSQARAQGWQKSYFRGETADHEKAAGEDHRTRLRLKPFTETDG